MADTGFGLPSSDDFERDTERLNLTLADSARVGYGMAQGVDADYYADVARLAKATGRPIDLVMANPAEAKAQQAVEAVDFDAMAQVAPHTAKILADIDKAKLVGNDVDQIQGVEKSWRERAVDRIGQPVMRGLISADKLFNSALYLSGVTAKLDTYEQQYQENIGSTSTVADREARRQAGFTKESMRYESTDKAIQEGKQQIAASNGVGEALVAYLMNPAATADMFIENTAMMVPTLAVTGAAGLVAGPFGTATAAASTSYMIEYSSTVLGEMEDRGVDMRDPLQIAAAYQNPELMAAARLKATKRGVAVATFDAISGGLAGKFLKTVGPKATVRQTLMASAKEGGAQVALGMGGEAYGQIVTDDYSASDLLAEGLFELPGGATEVLSNTKHARRYNQWVDSETERIDQAAKTKVQFDKLADMAKADKVLARAPEIVEEIVQNATEDSDGSHIYVSANALNQSGLAAQVAEASPTVAAEIAQATQDNGLIAIPAAEYATKIANQPWAQDFNNHIKATPDDYSPAEAQKIIDTNGAELKADFDLAMQSLDADEVFETSAGTVKDSILADLNGIQAHSASVNEGVATAFSAYYATRAKQLGVTPEALYALRPLSWRSEAMQGDLRQGGGAPSLQDISSKWSDKGLSVAVRQSPNGLVTLDKVIVPTEQRGAGVGSEFMQELLAYADQQGVQVALTPSKDFGGSVPRLKAFYKQMGFVENKGKNKNLEISEQFYRDPVARASVPQTETAAFKAWFKDSKVVDADGKPLVVYHGTDQSFDSFDGGKLGEATGAASAGQGFFFVARPDVAESYANYAALDAPIRREVLQADRLEAKGDFDGYDAAIVRAEQLEQEIGSQRSRGQNIVPTYLSIQNPAIMDAKEETFTTLQDEINAFIKKAKKDGRDGVIIKNLDDDPRFSDRVGDHYIAFTNTQIKSAIGNSGDFSSTNPNILKQGAYHGSPHKFSQFSTTAIGTGEGAQAFGWGLYFAGERDLAEHYRKTISNNLFVTPTGRVFNPMTELAHLNVRTRAYKGDLDVAIAKAEEIAGSDNLSAHLAAKDLTILRGLAAEGGIAKTDGQVYEVEIPDDDNLLLWDKPISQQSPVVQAALQRMAEDGVDIYPSLNGMMQSFEVGSTTGEAIYHALARESGSDQSASLELLASGIKGIKYLDGASRSAGDGSFNFVVFSGDDVAIRNQFYQSGTAPRGSFNPDTFTIALLKGADLSTALHEGAHFFFENDLALASQIVAGGSISEGEKQLLADVSTLLTWHGITGDIKEQLNTWYSLDREVTREYHEQTAESFERYLLEGKSPSPEMQVYFQKFRAWMLSVYKSVKEQLARNPRGGALNDDVRGVFDRMLATNEQIAQAQQARGMMDMFTTAEAGGMTAEEFAQYQALGREPTNEAIEQMQAKGMKDMAWLQRTRNKKIKALQKEANALRAEARNEARRVVMSEPIYQAWQLLTAKMTKEDKLPAKPRVTTQENMLDAMANLGGMNESELKSLYGVDRKNYPLKNTVFGKPVIRKSGGISVDYMGQLLAENGYLALNEEGQYDDADFEAKLMDSLAGIDQYSYFHDYGQEEFRAGDQVANPSALAAARLDGEELRAMGTVTDVQIEYLRKLGMVSNNGLHPDIVTNIIEGFSSGDELVQELLEAQDPNAMIEAMVDQAMIERHGELSSPQAIEQAADAAVFNEARVRFAANEANALAKATGKRKVLLDAAKDFARERIARTLIRDLRPAKYAAASGVAAKEAAAAMKRGDTEQAAAQKRNEVMQSTAAKEAFDAKEEVTKAIAYFKRIQASKSIATDALIQIEELLGKYDLRVSQSLKAIDRKTSMVEYVKAQIKDGNLPDIGAEMLDPVARASYEALTSEVNDLGEVVYADDADRIELLAGYLDAAESTHYKNMTVEQLRGLRDTVEQIAHIGGLKNRLLNKQEKRSLDEAKQEISESIIANARKDGQLQPTRGTKYERAMGAVKRYVSAHIRMASRAFVIDGGKDNGAFWRYFILPANQATDKESSLNIEITTKLHAIMKPLMPRARSLERLNSSKYYKTLGTSLNWENRFAILLNMGNESNTQRLVSGGVNGKGSVTLGAVMDVMSEFSEAEILAAQQVWDLFESLRPQIAELEVATKGREPNWIPPRPLTVKSKEGKLVTLRGGYYPVVYDHGINIRAAEDLADSNANIEKRAARATATTRQSFVKARVAEVHNRPLLLTLDSLFGGFADVVHDLSWREYAIDTSKLLKSKRIRDAIGEHHGMETWQQLTSFTKDLVAGVPRQNDGVAAATAFIRKNVAMAGLGLNLINWMQQPFGVFNGVPRLGGGREGWKWIGRGMTKYFANPAKATREMRASSEFMEARGRTRFRELNEISNQIRGQTVGSQIAPYLISGMIFTQTIADTIVWHAMVEKAYTDNPSLTEERAHAMGDQAVRDSQGGGQQVDLSTMERQKDGFLKLFTVFMSFMNTSNNLAYMSAKTGRSKAAKIGDLFVVFMIPVLSTALLKGLVIPSGDDDDDGKWIEDLALDLATFPLSGFIVLREIVPAIAAFSGAGYGGDYKGPAGTRLISDLVSFGKQANQGELDDPFRKAFVNLMGSGFGLPAAQINRTITGAKALDEGATENPAALVFGFKR